MVSDINNLKEKIKALHTKAEVSKKHLNQEKVKLENEKLF